MEEKDKGEELPEEENDGNEDVPSENTEGANEDPGTDDTDNTISLSGLYQNWFLDYASYVILERAVPALEDGLKPVQRRILHSMRELEDGRYNKVANVIGNTMKYHPHGDTSIGDAMVQIGQKDMAIDTQGNWGNVLTGDRAAAARYIEARLSKFALEVIFNPKTTKWQLSYDGRNKEPVNLPIKFPLLLAQGAEGIAVGLACKILPHNFIELIDASIDVLKGRKPEFYPDFVNGGLADFSNYNDGLRGGKVRVRARIKKEDKKTLVIHEIPFGATTTSLIESIIKANDKGKIKIKKIEDNTAEFAEIVIHLAPEVSPDKTIDALYAFTDCEVSISPNACVIENDVPRFLGVTEMLRISTARTTDLLKQELEIRKGELLDSWHYSSLEKIFIENRIYRDIEEAETWDQVMENIKKGLKPFLKLLKREVTDEDIQRLTEIKIKRISKFDSFKADEEIRKLEEELITVQHNLDNLTDFAIKYFAKLKEKYSAGKERKTEIKTFDNISARKVIIANKKLYVNYAEGFIGWSLRKDEFIADCSEIDDIIVFKKNGKMEVTQISEKKFVGKDILYANVWKKGDKRTIYHMIYRDGKSGPFMMKRFYVNSVTRDKDYDLTKGTKGSSVHYLTANPNGERELITILLRPRPHLKKIKFDVDFSNLAIKGRNANGNILTKEAISKIVFREKGGSTLAARKIWFDDVVSRLNDEGRGELLGSFSGEDKILTVYKAGYYKLIDFALINRFDDDLILIEKFNTEKPLSVVYFDGEKEKFFVKRFIPEESDKKVYFISESEGSLLELVSSYYHPFIKIVFDKRLRATKNLPDLEIDLNEFIAIKGLKAIGNQLTKLKVKTIELLPPNQELEEQEKQNEPDNNSDTTDEQEEQDNVENGDETNENNNSDPVEKVETETTTEEKSNDEAPQKAVVDKKEKKQVVPTKKPVIKPADDDKGTQISLFD